jgi:peptide/nickel transport system substrate-binding protein
MKKLFSPKALKQNQDLIREAHLQLSRNRISRRDFLRFASAMGAGAFGMQLLSPLGRTRAHGAAQDAAPVRGGTIYSALGIDTRRFDDPAKMDQVFVSNYVRQVCDYLVVLDPDLILQPALATGWTPSADGLDWTITLREGVKFNHGKDFNADDVVFTFTRLIDPETASGWAGAANYVTGVEKIDDFTVVFHTSRVVADFPYTLFLYHAAILPADWPGDFFTNPWGTGPFTIEEHVPDEFVRFRRREDYWQMGADGQPLPYVDAVEFVSYPDEAARFSALQEGSLHLAPASITLRDQYLTLTNYDFSTVQTGNLHIGIMQFNQEPWTNPLAVEALKLSIDRKAYADTPVPRSGD